MEAQSLGINDVLNRSNILRIPYFQRRYVWGKDSWERFAIDMESTIDSSQSYFLGALIFNVEETSDSDKDKGVGNTYVVVDGQQRLTTLLIYMKVLCLSETDLGNSVFSSQYIIDGNNPILNHNHEDSAAFNEIMALNTLKSFQNKESNIYKAYHFFRTYLSESKNRGVNIKTLKNRITAIVKFVVIKLNGEKDDEQKIFDTINSLGVPLTTGELMKNFLYKVDNEELYRDTWRKVFDTDESLEFWNADKSKSRQAKNPKNFNIEVFFHAFVRIKMWDFKDKLNANQRKTFVKSENVFSTCKSFVEIFGMKRLDLANEIIEYAELFRNYFDNKILSQTIPTYPCIERSACFINATKTYSVIPYVLYLLKNVQSEPERNKIFGYLETYLVRRMLAGSDNKNYSDLFSENLIGNNVNTYVGFVNYINGKEGALAMPTDSDIQNAVFVRKVNDVTPLYYLYESKLKNNDKIEAYSDYMSDKLMPTPKKDNYGTWPQEPNPDNEELRKQLSETLGNFFILSKSGKKAINKVEDKALSDKLYIFRKNAITLNMSYNSLDNIKNVWDAERINKRNIDFAKHFCEIFPLVNNN